MNEVINRIDGVLLGDDFASLTGMSATLDTTIDTPISENLYNDEIITTLIRTVYPMIRDLVHDAIDDNADLRLRDWPRGGSVSIDLRDYASGIAESLIAYVQRRLLQPIKPRGHGGAYCVPDFHNDRAYRLAPAREHRA